MQSRKQVWILEDEVGLQEIYREFLKEEYDVHSFHTINELNQEITNPTRPHPDAILCDIRLPDGTIFDLTKTSVWRDFMRNTKVFMVTATDDVESVKRCFKEGAVDCMSKPFRKNELQAKLQVYLAPEKANANSDGAPHGAGHAAHLHGLRIDLHDMRIYRDTRKSEPFTSKEVQIMSHLLDTPNLQATRADLVQRVWRTTKVTTKTLDVHLFNLRKKLAPIKISIKFVEPTSYLLHLED